MGLVVWIRDGDRDTWIGAVPPYAHWSAQPSEAQVAAMQAQPLPPEPGVRALGAWHVLFNPPAPERDPRD